MTDGFFCVKKSVTPAVFQEDLAYWRQERTTKKNGYKKREKEDGERAEEEENEKQMYV